MIGWTATKVGKLGFDGVVSVQNGESHMEARSTETHQWDENFISNALFVDYIDLPLTQSYSATHDSFGSVDVLGGPMTGGLLLPWNELPGGMTISNVTFVNHLEPVLRGGAHIARGGSPSTGDGGWETRFQGVKFVNTSQRASFRHPHEAFFYDLDGTLTGSGIEEDYVRSGGSVKGSSLVPRSVLRPPEHCADTQIATSSPSGHYGDVGGMVCHGVIFRRVVFKAIEATALVGKSMCVRPSWDANVNRCHEREAQCNCIEIQKKWWGGNVALLSIAHRFNYDIDLLDHERIDPSRYQIVAWGMQSRERIMITMRFLQWKVADDYGRPLFQMRVRDTPSSTQYYMDEAWGATTWRDVTAANYEATSECDGTTGYCGKVQLNTSWEHEDFDQVGSYQAGVASEGFVPIPAPGADGFAYTVKEDPAGDAALVTMLLTNGDLVQRHVAAEIYVNACPSEGCWPGKWDEESLTICL